LSFAKGIPNYESFILLHLHVDCRTQFFVSCSLTTNTHTNLSPKCYTVITTLLESP